VQLRPVKSSGQLLKLSPASSLMLLAKCILQAVNHCGYSAHQAMKIQMKKELDFSNSLYFLG
jgi:hypothetical protein